MACKECKKLKEQTKQAVAWLKENLSFLDEEDPVLKLIDKTFSGVEPKQEGK